MKNLKILFCLFFLLSIGSTNVWGDTDYSRDGIIATYSGTVLTISAGSTGVIPNYTYNSAKTSEKAPWDAAMNSITEVKINEGITYIGTDAFRGANSLSKVTIPVSLDSVSDNAFKGCTKVANIYYKGLPSEWASIGFYAQYSHPFGASSGVTRKMFFYGNTDSGSETTTLFIEPTITEIKKFAFFHADLQSVCIPGTVKYIRENAFNCTIATDIYINRAKAPNLGTDALLSGTKKLYTPLEKSGDGYNVAPWSSFTRETFKTSDKLSDSEIPWNLDENGLLTIDATGKETKSISFELAGDDYPWGKLRRLVYKIKITGEMTGIGRLLRYHYGISELIIDQSNIPSIAAAYIATQSSPVRAYSHLFNKRDQLKLRVKPETLLNVTEVAKLTSSPWNDTKSGTTKWWQVGLSETATLYDNGLNLDTLEAIKEHVDLPINLQLNRTLSNEYYNTFCSPVDMTAEKVTAMFDAETKLVEFDRTEIINDTLRLKFKEATSITAGKPYLIWPESPVSNPTFTDVNPASIATSGSIVSGTYADFYGTLAPVVVSPGQIEDKNFIFLLANNKLTYATSGTLKGMRAYFLLKEGTPSSVMAKRPVLQIGNGENTTTDLGQVPSDKIQCTKVLRDGQIYILRGEKAYNLQGIEIETTRY